MVEQAGWMPVLHPVQVWGGANSGQEETSPLPWCNAARAPMDLLESAPPQTVV